MSEQTIKEMNRKVNEQEYYVLKYLIAGPLIPNHETLQVIEDLIKNNFTTKSKEVYDVDECSLGLVYYEGKEILVFSEIKYISPDIYEIGRFFIYNGNWCWEDDFEIFIEAQEANIENKQLNDKKEWDILDYIKN